MPFSLKPVAKGRRIPLEKAIVFLGRHPDCDVVLTRSRKVSRKHCCIAQVNDSFVIRDLGSLNGIRVNGKRVRHECPVHVGDEVTIGDLRYHLENGPAEPKVRPREPVEKPIKPPRPTPADLSQEIPVPIPDEDEDFQVVASRRQAALELDEPAGADSLEILDDDSDVEVAELVDDVDDDDSQVELLSE